MQPIWERTAKWPEAIMQRKKVKLEQLRWDKIEYPSTDQWGSFKAQQKLHFKAFFHAVH